jgi:hypothetical protein
MRSDSFESVIDADGRRKKILRDGHVLRVPLMLRDSANPALTPLQRAVASRRQLSDAEVRSSRPGFRYGSRPASDRQAMYDAYDRGIADEYLKPLGFGTDPALTGTGSQGPRQEPPEGGVCTRDGFPGVWRRGDDGKMVCDIAAARRNADAKARLRSRIDDPDEDDEEDEDNGDDERTDDRRSVAQVAADHQRSMQRLYDERDRELEAAHRKVDP